MTSTVDQPSTIERLRAPMPADGRLSWLVTAILGVVALLLRGWRVWSPRYLAFDETYYAKDAWTLIHLGHEQSWPAEVDAKVNAGTTMIWNANDPTMAAHPPFGKWLIGLGEWLFGMTPFGWRFMSVVFGAIMVMAVVRLARRLSRSTLVGAIAGFLLLMDGLAFVMSRLALLDIFQATFLVLGVAAMVCDRDWMRAQLAAHLQVKGIPDLGGAYGPRLWWRPWRFTAGIIFGLAIGVKWNSIFVLAVMCVLTLIWDVSARRLAGAGKAAWRGLLSDGIPAFLHQVIVAIVVYIATWAGWLLTSTGYDRNFVAQNPTDAFATSGWRKVLGDPLMNLAKLHFDIYSFHQNKEWWLGVTHPYNAHPAGWLLMLRPIGIDAINDIPTGERGCPATGDKCLQVISAMGTPLLWWLAFAALVAGLFFWVGGRDWRFSVPIVAAMATYLPWFGSTFRPLFFFYAICIIPFTCINLALVLGKILGPANGGSRRQMGAIVVGAALGLITLNFAWIHPILSDTTLPHWAWLARMWLASWI